MMGEYVGDDFGLRFFTSTDGRCGDRRVAGVMVGSAASSLKSQHLS